ncbi:MAG: iron-sulfur cluster assembly accessory protein [Candidatus Eisenbacteria bacterium]|uniref:Iron-sulfur cluster assembly accessory protein n=1 Tax=Eiseniibacteriota bacterium TaxID=2212470 RepID=A0A849SJ64_UNCEI|nr:iron-sulfur cluster assembly accessory protein [Candidatus Eisenbacteria bacterium]
MLTLTDAATKKLGEIITEQTTLQADPIVGLRVFVQKGGCSGYSYGMSLASTVDTGDWVGEFGGVKVVVDPQSAAVLDGVRIDYVESLQGNGFSIQNPNAVRSCGCGNSFETAETAETAQGKDAAHGGEAHA